jgi:hypothetical protein
VERSFVQQGEKMDEALANIRFGPRTAAKQDQAGLGALIKRKQPRILEIGCYNDAVLRNGALQNLRVRRMRHSDLARMNSVMALLDQPPRKLGR